MVVQETTFAELLKKSIHDRNTDEHLCIIDGICRRYPTPFANEYAVNSYKNRVLADYDIKVAYHMLKVANRTKEADAILSQYKETVKINLSS